MSSPDPIATEFLARSRYLLTDEYRTKLRKTLDALPADAIWWRANEQSNSVGNLLLHLAGNVRQWIVSGVGGAVDKRFRAGEFTANGGQSADELWATLDAALRDADAVIAKLDAAALERRLTIQGREVSVLEAVYHVVEHFSMHMGQIILIAKLSAPGSIQFYRDEGGLARPLWKDGAEKFRQK
jgi:uncharacterized damage-inducible protein DinB